MSGGPSNAEAQTHLPTAQKVYLWLGAVFVASLLIADLMGVKLFSIPLGFSFHVPWQKDPIDSVTHTAGMLTFPVTFLLTDLVNEYYGKRAARRLVWIGFAMGGFVFIVVNVGLALPHWKSPYNVDEGAFNAIFSNSRVMYMASLAAFLIGSMSDIFMFGRLKRLTKGRMVWLRATGSTVISQLIDSFFVTWLAFSVGRHLFGGGEPMPMDGILRMAATGYLLKFVIAIGLTPVIYLGRWVMNKYFGMTPLPVDHA